MIGQAPVQPVVHCYQQAQGIAHGQIVAFDIHLGIAAAGDRAGHGRVRHIAAQGAVDAVEGGAKAYGYLVGEGVAQGGLDGNHLHFAFQAVVAALPAILVITDDAKGGVHADAGMPVVVERGDVIAKRNGGEGHHVTVVAAALAQFPLGVTDVGAGVNKGQAAADLGALQTAHTGRVAIKGAGVGGAGSATGVGGAGAAGALFVEGQAIGQGLAGSRGNGCCQQGVVRILHDSFPELFFARAS